MEEKIGSEEKDFSSYSAILGIGSNIEEILRLEPKKTEEIEKDEEEKRMFEFSLPRRFRPPFKRLSPNQNFVGHGFWRECLEISCLDKISRKTVCIHILKDVFQRGELAERVIVQEIRIMKHFRHENLINLYDVFHYNKKPNECDVYIVKENFEGSSLRKVIGKFGGESFDEDIIKKIVYGLLKAINYIHCSGNLHGNIKPSNILVNENCEVKLIEMVSPEKLESRNNLYGKPVKYYDSPEKMMMWENKSHPARDIWSVGCIIGSLLSTEKVFNHRLLFKGAGFINQLLKIFEILGIPSKESLETYVSKSALLWIIRVEEDDNIKKGPIDLSEKFPHASEEIIDLLEKMLELDPFRRITARDALQHPFFKDFFEEKDIIEEEKPKFSFSMDWKGKEKEEIMMDEIKDWEENYFLFGDDDTEKNDFLERKKFLLDCGDEYYFSKKKEDVQSLLFFSLNFIQSNYRIENIPKLLLLI